MGRGPLADPGRVGDPWGGPEPVGGLMGMSRIGRETLKEV